MDTTTSPQPACGHTICAPGGRPCLFTGQTDAPRRPTDYDWRCEAAADAQGLGPITAALDAVGITHAVEQTGGMCMVVTVHTGNLAGEPGVFTITAAEDTTRPAMGDDSADYWLVGFHPGATWDTGDHPDGEDSPDETTLTTAALLEVLTAQTAA